MRVIRAAGQNVSPSDDGRLFDQIFEDGLFEDTTITLSGTTDISIGALYGVMCGRDFTAEAQTISPVLPEDSSSTTGYVYVEYNTAVTPIMSIKTALTPFTPTYENINVIGTTCQMIIASYVANSVAISSVTPLYTKARQGVASNASFTILASGWGNTATVDNVTYNIYSINLTKVMDASPVIGIGALNTLPSEAEQKAFNKFQYAIVDDENLTLTLYAKSAPANNFVILVKGVQ